MLSSLSCISVIIAPSKNIWQPPIGIIRLNACFRLFCVFLRVKRGNRSLYIALQYAPKLAILRYKIQKLATSPSPPLVGRGVPIPTPRVVNGGGWRGCIPPTFWQGGCNASHPPLLRRTCVNHHNVTFN